MHIISFISRLMTTIRLNRVLFLLFFVLFLLILVSHYHLSKVVVYGNNNRNGLPNGYTDYYADGIGDLSDNDYRSIDSGRRSAQFYHLVSDDTKLRTKDVLRIKSSVSKELRILESELHKIQSERSVETSKLEAVKYRINHAKSQLNRLLVSIDEARRQLSELRESYTQTQFLNLKPSKYIDFYSNELHAKTSNLNSIYCTISSCIDFSRCPLMNGFTTYTYPKIISDSPSFNNDQHLPLFESIHHINSNIQHPPACIYFVIISVKNNSSESMAILEAKLKNLSHWTNGGTNHVLINLNSSIDLVNAGLKSMRYLMVSTNFLINSFRNKFDIVFPPYSNQFQNNHSNMAKLCPAKRRYLLSYVENIRNLKKHLITQKLLSELEEMANSFPGNDIYFNFDCGKHCINHLINSTFSLILPPSDRSQYSDYSLSEKVINMISFGVIPIILDGDDFHLPFDEVIDWKKIVITLPASRLSEIIPIIRSVPDSDVLSVKRRGKIVYDRYLKSTANHLQTLSSILSHRLHFPSPKIIESELSLLHKSQYSPKILHSNELVQQQQEVTETDEILGPIEAPFPSPSFLRNFSLNLFNSYELWNVDGFDPFYTYPNLPFDPVLPSEAKFLGSGEGFRPIGNGAGGSGKEFSESLGGNYPKEQFTIVMLTYEREKVLLDSLSRLRDLPYLNKIIVIWNNPHKKLSSYLNWPELGVPLVVMKADKNSLNNRFRPYREIETEAILSMDDDAHLRHDEIIFGFR